MASRYPLGKSRKPSPERTPVASAATSSTSVQSASNLPRLPADQLAVRPPAVDEGKEREVDDGKEREVDPKRFLRWKPVGNELPSEGAPATEDPRIGIELEGSGTLTAKAKTGKGGARENIIHLLRKLEPGNDNSRGVIDRRKEAIKKQGLVHSDSTAADGEPDVTAHPEPTVPEGPYTNTELVTRPFARNAHDVQTMVRAVNTLRSPGKKETTTLASLHGKDVPVEAFYTPGGTPDNYRKLQSTVGISAQSLLSDHSGHRNDVIDYLVADKDKRALVKHHVETAIAMERFLTAQRAHQEQSQALAMSGGGASMDAASSSVAPAMVTATASSPSSSSTAPTGEAAEKADDMKYRTRLALLMTLMHAHADSHSITKERLRKDTYGLNIKGYSGFEGLRLDADSPDRQGLEAISGRAGRGLSPEQAEAKAHKLRGELEKSQGRRLTKEEHIALNNVGRPGLSMQAAYEGGTPLKTFIPAGTQRLHTPIESRESASPLNQDVASLLEADRKKAESDPDALKRITRIGT